MWLTDYIPSAGEPLQVTCKLSGRASRNAGNNLTVVPTPSCAAIGDYQVLVWQYFTNGSPIWDYNDFGPGVGQWKSASFTPGSGDRSNLSFRKITAENIGQPFTLQQVSGLLDVRYATFIIKGKIRDTDPIVAVVPSGRNSIGAATALQHIEMPTRLPLTAAGDMVITYVGQSRSAATQGLIQLPAEDTQRVLAADATYDANASAGVPNVCYVAQLLDGSTYSNMNGDGDPLDGWSFSRYNRRVDLEGQNTRFAVYETTAASGTRKGMYKNFDLVAGERYVISVDCGSEGHTGTGTNTTSPWIIVTPPSGAGNEYGAIGNGLVNSFLGFGGMTITNYLRQLYTNNSFGGYSYTTGLQFVAAETGTHTIWFGTERQVDIAGFPGNLTSLAGSTARGVRGNFISMVKMQSPANQFEMGPYAGLMERPSQPQYRQATNRRVVLAPYRPDSSSFANFRFSSIFRSGTEKRGLNRVNLHSTIMRITQQENDEGRQISPGHVGDFNTDSAFYRHSAEIVGCWIASKFYFEITVTAAGTNYAVGYMYSGGQIETSTTNPPGNGAIGYLAGAGPTKVYNYNSTQTGLANWQVGDVIGFLLDLSNVNDVRVDVTRNGVPYGTKGILPSSEIWHQCGLCVWASDRFYNTGEDAGRYTMNLTGPFVFRPAGALAFDFDNDIGESGIPSSATQVLLHLDGTEGSTTITDSSVWKRTWQTGQASLTTAVKKFGTASWRATGQYAGISIVGTTSNQAFRLDNGDWCMECWINHPVGDFGNGSLLSVGYPSLNDRLEIKFLSGNNIEVRSYVGGVLVWTLPTVFIENVWQHVALVRHNGDVKFYIDGNLRGTRVAAELLTATEPYFNISGNLGGAYEYVEGYIDEVRFTKGYPRYTAAFTPPTDPFPDT